MMGHLRVQVSVSDDELRKWADWHAHHGHPGVAEVLYRAAAGVPIQATAIARIRAAVESIAHGTTEGAALDEITAAIKDAS